MQTLGGCSKLHFTISGRAIHNLYRSICLQKLKRQSMAHRQVRAKSAANSGVTIGDVASNGTWKYVQILTQIEWRNGRMQKNWNEWKQNIIYDSFIN